MNTMTCVTVLIAFTAYKMKGWRRKWATYRLGISVRQADVHSTRSDHSADHAQAMANRGPSRDEGHRSLGRHYRLRHLLLGVDGGRDQRHYRHSLQGLTKGAFGPPMFQAHQ